jgi:competence protein ComEC
MTFSCEKPSLSREGGRRPGGFVIWILIFLICFLIYKFIDKDSLIGVIFKNLPPREAALMAGMVFGDQNNFDKNMISSFRDSGVIHIMVVSGTNIILVFRGLVERLASWVGRKKAIIFGFGMILIYMNWVGFEIPAVRAFLLMSLFYWAQLLGRKFDLGRAIILIILIMVLADYRVLFSASFYLSFVAFGAVVLNFQKERKWWSDLWNSFWVSLWLLPILVMLFGKMSLVAPITNFFILFLIEIITILGILGGVLGLIVPVLGKIILWLSFPLLKYILLIVEGLGSLSWASVEIKFNWIWLIGWYLLLIYFLFKNSRHEFFMSGECGRPRSRP